MAVDGGCVFSRFRKERNGIVMLLVLFGATEWLAVSRRPCAKMPSSVAVPAGQTKRGKDEVYC